MPGLDQLMLSHQPVQKPVFSHLPALLRSNGLNMEFVPMQLHPVRSLLKVRGTDFCRVTLKINSIWQKRILLDDLASTRNSQTLHPTWYPIFLHTSTEKSLLSMVVNGLKAQVNSICSKI